MKSLPLIIFFIGLILGMNVFASDEEKKPEFRPPQFDEPKAGRTLDQSFKVALEGMPAGANCVSVMQDQATVLISRELLEYLKEAGLEESKPKADHMAVLRGNRAKILLDNVGNIKDDSGCLIVQTPFNGDADYLISDLLKSGQAGVIDNSINRPADFIYVRYKAFVAGPLAGKGDIIFSFAENSASFFKVLWWVS